VRDSNSSAPIASTCRRGSTGSGSRDASRCWRRNVSDRACDGHADERTTAAVQPSAVVSPPPCPARPARPRNTKQESGPLPRDHPLAQPTVGERHSQQRLQAHDERERPAGRCCCSATNTPPR
jgi:hypothetical protein